MTDIYQQDPHNTAPFAESDLCSAVGRQARAFRMQKGMTIAQLADEMGISNGMLSMIKNGQTAPSLVTLEALSRHLERLAFNLGHIQPRKSSSSIRLACIGRRFR
ncbi:helix-turn-helix domain-containing protein [Sulfitobacter sp. JBTF-M27]|uniref:Helix-turn-helix domain-containing protein n=1 Tax=Sulfitobacter sediminilitoris TaxID=2698830 RepID=A0A6P0CGH6_9RHOB|nr:helix-turn-helix transcriptional regulator [Sulfitobacter sediminilitoris]NEK24176.1 helix-turn-helix domain-containing protein [Sulfitobacter sediminilitoris]